MIAKDNMPFQIVDNEGFKNLMKTTVPLYSVPGRKSITKKMEEKYEYLKACEIQKLKKMDYFSVTADIWTEVLNTVSYLGMTVHYVFENELRATTIVVTEMTERHTSEVIGRWMKTILKNWHINDEKIVIVVTDNGSNIKKVVKDAFGSARHIGCFAHSINLVAQDTMNFEDATSLCAKVKKIVTYFKQFTIAADALRKATHFKLIQSVDTRWNSIFAMLVRFISLSKEVGSILLSIPDSPEKTQTALSLVNRLQNSISIRFGQIENNSIMAVSTILDPRFKKLHFNQPLACLHAIGRIAGWMRELDQTNLSNIVETNKEVSDKTDDLWSFHDDLKSKSANITQRHQDEIPTDLKHYLNQPMIDRKENPLYYWLNFASVYPILSDIAKKYLVIVATSVPSERLFSRAGNILTDSRNRLSANHLQELLFLNSVSIKDRQLKKE